MYDKNLINKVRDHFSVEFFLQVVRIQALRFCNICLIMIPSLLLPGCSTPNPAGTLVPEISVSFTKYPVKIDGIFNEPVWQEAQTVLLKDNKTSVQISDKSRLTKVRACYDCSHIYFSFVNHDQDIWSDFTGRDQHLWEEEAVEVFINTDDEPDTYVEIEISPHNILFDSYIVDPRNIDVPATKVFDLPGIQTAVAVVGTLDNRSDSDEHWNVEIAIPFSDLAIKEKYASPDSSWRINFYRINRDRGKNSESYAWSPTFGRFHKPAAFGIVKFQK